MLFFSGEIFKMAGKYTTEFVRETLAKEDWELVGEYKNVTTHLHIRNKNYFKGHIVKFRIDHWLRGQRPKQESQLLEPEKYIEEILAQEGWELLSHFYGSSKHIYIRNPNFCNGHVCKIIYQSWTFGFRPDMNSLIEPTLYVKEELDKEGWELLTNYEGSSKNFIIRNPDFFSGSLVTFNWASWKFGYRPKFQSLLDKKQYIRNTVDLYGWELVDVDLESKRVPILLIKHPEKFNGFLCKVYYYNWNEQSKLDIRNVVDKTEYIKSVLNDYGFEPQDKNWVFRDKSVRFSIVEIKTNKFYSTNWSSISRGVLPRTPKYRIFNTLASFFNRSDKNKYFYKSKIFTQDYWERLNKKFPDIPEGHHIDHIIPLSFHGESWEQMLNANDPRNLRLLEEKENQSRGNRLKASELDEYDLWDLYYQAENPKGLPLIEDRYNLAG
jgi:hypothetical protein